MISADSKPRLRPGMRSLLVVPAGNGQAMEQASRAAADILVLDLAHDLHADLRRASRFLEAPRSAPVFVRVAPLESGKTASQLDAIMPARPDGIVLTGSRGGTDVTRLSALLRPREAMAGIEDGATHIIAMATDTPAALFDMASYRDASARLTGLAWDTEVLAIALGATDIADLERTARTTTLIAAAAAGVVAIDSPFRGSDLSELETGAIAARNRGFGAKIALNPDQVPVINAVFSRPAASSS